VQVDFKKVGRIWALVAAPAGVLLIVLAVREHRLSAGVCGGLLLLSAVPPLFEIMLVVVIGIGALTIFLPCQMLWNHIRRRRQEQAIRELDRLGREGAQTEAYGPELAKLQRLEPDVIGPVLERLLDRRCPYRELLFWHGAPGTLDEIARREDDPLAVRAWYDGLARRHDVNQMPPATCRASTSCAG